MVSFEIFVKAMPPSLSELKVLPSFCFPIKIRDDRAITIIYLSSLTKKLIYGKNLEIPVILNNSIGMHCVMVSSFKLSIYLKPKC